MRRNARLNQLLLAVAAALFLAACGSSSDDDTSTANPSETSQSIDVDVASLSEEVATEEAPEVLGAPLNPFDLRVGQCYNQGAWFDEEQERRIELTASIGCEQPHQREVFFEAEFPAPNGAPFPGEAAMQEWSTELCYGEFEPFVGLEYERSRYEIGFIHPTEATFEHEVGRHRRVTCVIYDLLGEELMGTAQGTGL